MNKETLIQTKAVEVALTLPLTFEYSMLSHHPGVKSLYHAGFLMRIEFFPVLNFWLQPV